MKEQAENFTSEEFLNAIFNSIQDGISVLNIDLTIRYVNPIMEKWYKHHKPLIGKKCYQCYHNTNHPCNPCPSLRCLKSGKTEIDIVPGFPDEDSPVKWLELYSYPIKDNKTGEITGIVEFVRNITKRRIAEEALSEAEARLREMSNTLPIGIFEANKDLYLTYMNEKAFEQTGYNNDDLKKGLYCLDLIIPEEREIANQNLAKRIEGKKLQPVEYTALKKDKSTFPILFTMSTVDKSGEIIGFRGAVTDISIVKEAEAALKTSEQRFRDLSDMLPIAVFETDENLLLTYANRCAFELFDYTQDDFNKGINCMDIIVPEDRKRASKNLEIRIHGKNLGAIEYTAQTKKGIKLSVLLNLVPVRTENKLAGFRGVAMDITLIKQTEGKLKAKNKAYLTINKKLQHSNILRKKVIEDLKIAKAKAVESDRLKTAFLANMSHEIRTPMNGILGFADLLKDEHIAQEEKLEYISIIEKSGERMLNTINDLIDISKIESGLVEINVSKTNANEILDYLYSFFKPEAEIYGLGLKFNKKFSDDDAIFYTDKEKLYAILTNLIKNAVKYSKKGNIEFGFKKKDSEFEFYVKDTGVGIPKDKLNAIFERFVQANTGNTSPYQGVGLGLSIAKAFVELLEGNIWVDSTLGKGSTFYFTLPMKPKKTTDTKSNIMDSNNLNGVDKLNDLTILIVEDDEVSGIFLSKLLKSRCKETILVKNGTEAINICKNNPNIDVILMDIKMAEMDGYEATLKIREFNKEVVIIAQTAYALPDDHEKSLAVGCNDFITKPIRKLELFELIEKHVK